MFRTAMENAAVLEMDTSVRRGPATVKARRLFSDPAAAYPYKHLKYGLEEARMMKSDWVYRRGDLYLAKVEAKGDIPQAPADAAQTETTQVDAEMLLKLLQKPELAALLKALAKSL